MNDQPTDADGGVPTRPGDQRRYCRGCGYDLLGIDWPGASCPECGQGFEPADPTTMRSAREMRRARARFNRFGIPVAMVLLAIVGFRSTVLPRPVDLLDWRLWVWLGDLYGVEKVSSVPAQRSFSSWIGAPHAFVHWWGDRPWRWEAVDAQGAIMWTIERRSEQDWSLLVTSDQVPYRQIMSAYSALKPEMFGVQYRQQPSGMTTEPFELHGSTAEVFGELVRRSGIELTPFFFRPDQPYIWTFDRERGRMITLDLDEALEADTEIAPDPSNGSYQNRPIVPRRPDGRSS